MTKPAETPVPPKVPEVKTKPPEQLPANVERLRSGNLRTNS